VGCVIIVNRELVLHKFPVRINLVTSAVLFCFENFAMDKRFPLIALAVVLCLTSETLGIRYKDCGSSLAKATAAIVQGCEQLDTCPLHKGVNVTFGIDFIPGADYDNLKMLVYGHIAGIDVPFPINNPDACKNSNITCPVQNGKSYSYRNVIFVKTEYPSLSLVVKLKLVNQAGNVLVCVVIPVQIVSSSQQSNSVLRFLPRQ
jgi:Niemann-Pick C2 protein